LYLLWITIVNPIGLCKRWCNIPVGILHIKN
jgi:hypothetical protein